MKINTLKVVSHWLRHRRILNCLSNLQAGPAGVFSHTEVFSCIFNTLKQVFKCKFQDTCFTYLLSSRKISSICLLISMQMMNRCRAILSPHSFLCRHLGMGHGNLIKALYLLQKITEIFYMMFSQPVNFDH